MNYGVFKSFVEDDEEKSVIEILENLESRQEVKDIKIKSANKKTVIYIVTSETRFETQTLLNEQLSDAGFRVISPSNLTILNGLTFSLLDA